MNAHSTIERLQKISARLSGPRRVTAQMLADELEVSSKTIYRDLDFMRDRLRLPIASNGVGFRNTELDVGFAFTRPVLLCACCCAIVKPARKAKMAG
jgi:hypothetical protein